MIIILEGFDESGKSTLANELSKKLGFNVLHPGIRPATLEVALDMCDKQDGILSYADQINLIMDRVTCISSPCYKLNINAQFAKYQSLIAASKDIKLIMCKYNGKDLKNTSYDVEDSVKFATQSMREIINRYNSMANAMPCHIYDYTEFDALHKVLKFIGFENIK